MISDESMLYDVDNFGVVENINKAIQRSLQTIKCSVSVIGRLVDESDFKKDFVEYRATVEDISKTNVEKCAQLDGVQLKFK